MDVFFYEAFEEEAVALSHHLPDSLQAGFTWKTIQEQGDSELPAAIISVRTQSKILPAWADRLSGILTRSTGYDHIKAYHAQCQKKIPSGYLPLYCNQAVAEQVLLLLICILRKLHLQFKNFRTFHRDGLTGTEMKGKKFLVVGVGNIGSEIVRIGQGLGMTVKGVDIVERYDFIDYVSKEEGIEWADIIVCSMSLTPENRGYFNYDLLSQAKPGAVFINVARGEHSPAVDLLRLCEEGHLGGIGLDVYNNESELAVSLRTGREIVQSEIQAVLNLMEHPNVILTPHNAFNTKEAVEKKASQSVEQIQSFLKSGQFIWPVPMD
jgi:D-lactate dehydrogenase